MIWGVLQFPGSCDERDALRACSRHGEARLIWHQERDLGGLDAVIIPGGFSYGDYLRAGAIARFSPAMEAVAEFAAAGGAVLGICNGFQVLCEAGLLPGALLLNQQMRFVCRQLELVVEGTNSPFISELSARRAALAAGQARGRPLLRASQSCSRRSRQTTRSPFAMHPVRTPTDQRLTSPGFLTEAATCSG